MKQFILLVIVSIVLAGCAVATQETIPTPIPPTPTPAPPKAVALFMENGGMTQEQAEEALGVLNSIGVEDISRLDFEKEDIPGKWYITDLQGFPDAKMYINVNKKIYRVTDSLGEMSFYNGFEGGVEEIVTDFVLDSNEENLYIELAKEYALGGLKAPATAQFPEMTSSDWNVARYGHYVEVKSWVDAENSFGALLRNDFLVQINYETKELFSLYIDGDWVFGEKQHWRNN